MGATMAIFMGTTSTSKGFVKGCHVTLNFDEEHI